METAGLDTSYLGILLEDKGDYLTGNSMGGHIILFQHQIQVQLELFSQQTEFFQKNEVFLMVLADPK